MTELPLRVRRAARVLILDEDDRLLLMQDSDVGFPGPPTWWITPGGGIDGDETPVEAAVREVGEETGLEVAPEQLIGPVWHRAAVHHEFSDHRSEQEEHFFALRTANFTATHDGFTESEQESVLGERWWTAAELHATTDAIWPADLPTLLPDVLRKLAELGADAAPGRWPTPPVELPELTENPRHD